LDESQSTEIPLSDYPELGNLTWEELLELRRKYNDNPQVQNLLAPYEHMAYAREDVRDRPYMALPYMAMIPGYQAYKAMFTGGRSSNPLEAMSGGYKGVMQGLLQRLSNS
jgi:hypothetical protein